nr:probable LRR receptor-like serine/threonine-protein kinase At1g29720 [Coffea arabica]
MKNCNSISTPIEVGLKVIKESEGKRIDSTLYKQIVGSLMYLTATKSDIMHAVSLISRYMESPRETHLPAVKRILQYLQGIIEYRLFYKNGEKLDLFGFTDSDYASDSDDRKSTSGYVFMMGSTAISWCSKKQPIITLSTIEAKYIAAMAYACIIMQKLGGILKLTLFSLENNQIEGSIPRAIGNLTTLKELYLGVNNLTVLFDNNLTSESSSVELSFVTALTECRYLREISVANNPLTGVLPVSIGKLSPKTVGNLSNLRVLDLKENPLPNSLGNLTSLRYLYLASDRITSYVPDSLWSLKDLLGFILSSNFLTGSLPSEIGLLKVATWINLLMNHKRKDSYYELLQATNGYDESNLLGTGSFGSVYKGILANGMCVAIKVFNLPLEYSFKSFTRESEVLRSLRHRNLTKVIGVCSNDGFKPNNVLLNEDMVACVTNFGVAKILAGEKNTAYTKSLATFGYIAPAIACTEDSSRDRMNAMDVLASHVFNFVDLNQ